MEAPHGNVAEIKWQQILGAFRLGVPLGPSSLQKLSVKCPRAGPRSCTLGWIYFLAECR